MVEGELRDQISWNIAADQARHISDLIKSATRYYLDGNLGKWYWNLTAIREMINYNLKPEERKALDKIEKLAGRCGVIWEKHNRHEEVEQTKTKKFKRIRRLYAIVIREYWRKIMDFLNELGYFPSKEDRSDLGF